MALTRLGLILMESWRVWFPYVQETCHIIINWNSKFQLLYKKIADPKLLSVQYIYLCQFLNNVYLTNGGDSAGLLSDLNLYIFLVLSVSCLVAVILLHCGSSVTITNSHMCTHTWKIKLILVINKDPCIKYILLHIDSSTIFSSIT